MGGLPAVPWRRTRGKATGGLQGTRGVAGFLIHCPVFCFPFPQISHEFPNGVRGSRNVSIGFIDFTFPITSTLKRSPVQDRAPTRAHLFLSLGSHWLNTRYLAVLARRTCSQQLAVCPSLPHSWGSMWGPCWRFHHSMAGALSIHDYRL